MYCRGLVLSGLAALLGGCANLPHNNVLLFGTDTKVALDISSSATSGGAPQITIGYRRAEAVWMPLAVNDHVCEGSNGNCKVETAKRTITAGNNPKVTLDDGEVKLERDPANPGDIGINEPIRYRGYMKETKGDTVVSERRDAYSVFASFGAKFSGEATQSEAKASGGLAQFFATGIAAQKLAQSPSVDAILKVASGDEAKAVKAQAEAEKVKNEVKLSQERQKQIAADVNVQNEPKVAEAVIILDRCEGPEKNIARWQKAMDDADSNKLIPNFAAKRLRNHSKNAQVRSDLRNNDNWRVPIFKNLGTLCPDQ